MDFKERTKLKIAISKIEEENVINKKNNFEIKKSIGIVACFVIMISGIVYAKDIENYFKNIFNNSTEAIDKAVENGYVQQEEMDYTYDKDIGIKVDSLVLDNLNLAISFNFETKKEDIKSIRLKEFNITNDNNKVVYQSEIKHVENAEELPLYKTVTWNNISEKISDTTFTDSILFGLRPEKEDFKELYFDVKNLQLTYMDDSREIIDGNWKFNVTINDEMINSSTIIYNMAESNEYIESCIGTLSATGMTIEILAKNPIPYYDYFHEMIHLSNNNNTYTPNFAELSYNDLKIYFDNINLFTEDTTNLKLYFEFFDTSITLTSENTK